MFLTRSLRSFFGRGDRHGRRDGEAGNAMIAVIGLLAVTSIITMTITGATVRALNYTSLTRADVQSNAAAEAGVDAMLSALSSEACPDTGTLEATQRDVDPSLTGEQGTALFFSSTIAHRADSSSAWTSGCPTSAAREIRIQSTGYAADPGVAESASGWDASAVEAVYGWEPGEVPQASNGAAVYTYAAGLMTNNGRILGADGAKANVLVRTGSVSCSVNPFIDGDLVIANGNYSASGRCSVSGNVFVSGTFSNTGCTGPGCVYGGDIVAAGSGTSTIANNTIRIGGGVYVGGSLSSWATRCASPNNGHNNVGHACAIGSATGASPVLFQQSGLVIPPVPDWVDVPYIPQEWANAGWVTTTYSGPCFIDNSSKSNSAVVAISNISRPTVLNASGCSSFQISSSANLVISLKSDVTIILPRSVTLENLTVTSADGGNKTLRLITPDGTPGDGPTVSGRPTPSFSVNSGIRASDPVRLLIYTPANFQFNNTVTFDGQVYAGKVDLRNDGTVTFRPVGILNYPINGGTTGGGSGGGSTAGPGSLGEMLSFSDIPVPD